jgi:hypothetical protein
VLGEHPLIGLQRTAGNAAVSRLLARQPATDSPSDAGAGPVAGVLDPPAQAPPSSAPAPPSQAKPAPMREPEAPFWWPKLAGRKEPPSPEEQAKLSAIVDHRNSLSVRPELRTETREYGGKASTGYKYAGVSATPTSPATDPLHKIALAEYGQGEGGVSAVVTYDKTLSFGAGFADAVAAQWIRAWFDNDRGAELAFADAGMSVTADSKWLAVDDTAKVISGEPARQFIRGSPKLLSLYMTVTEEQEHTRLAAQAQQDWVKHWEIEKLPAALRAEMLTRPRGAVASALHLAHWLPVGGPIMNGAAYVGTQGNAVAIAKAFARGLANNDPASFKGANGAIVVGATVQTSTAVSYYFGDFGRGAGDQGYLKRGVLASAARLTKSVDEAKSDPSLAGHVLYLAGAWPNKNDVPVELLDLGQ